MTSLHEYFEKIKPFYTILLVVVVASIFFAVERLYDLELAQTPIKIQYGNATSTAGVINAVLPGDSGQGASGAVIGSKTGKKYYFPWCGTIKRVKPENQVPFASVEEARSAGYTPAGNCKGLK